MHSVRIKVRKGQAFQNTTSILVYLLYYQTKIISFGELFSDTGRVSIDVIIVPAVVVMLRMYPCTSGEKM